MTEDHFGDRYALELFSDGAVVADLVTGSYSRLNLAAAAICQELAKIDDLEFVGRRMADRWGISFVESMAAVSGVLKALEQPPPRRVRPDPFVYTPAPNGDGYLLSNGARPRLWIRPDGLVVRSVSSDDVGTEEMFHCLRSLAPKLLFLQGGCVLHGAASYRRSGVSVFCGDSGAGKTTTALAFESAGARLLAEDMLVVGSLSPLTAHVGGEEMIRSWAQEQAGRLSRSAAEVSANQLQEARCGPSIDVPEIWFIAAERRDLKAEQISLRRLGSTEGALAAMASVFLGGTTAGHLRRFLSIAAAIAGSPTTLSEAQMPDGLDRLLGAAKDYRLSSAW